MPSPISPEQGRSAVDFKRDIKKMTGPRSQIVPGQFQVLGSNLQIIIDGFGSFTLIANKILIEEGLGSDSGSGAVKFEAGAWYPLERWLTVLERIGNEFGQVLLFQSGMATPKNATFPPSVTDIHSALKCIDVAYHMNHAMRGEPMFSPHTGTMREGIGHYTYAHTPGKNLITMESTSPYPCDFDRGIIITMAQRFQPTATIIHDAAGSCRKRGEACCTYHVAWK